MKGKVIRDWFEGFAGIKFFNAILLIVVSFIFLLAYNDAIGDTPYMYLFVAKDVCIFLICFFLWPDKGISANYSLARTFFLLAAWFLTFYVFWILLTYAVSYLFRSIATDYNAHFDVFLNYVLAKGPLRMIIDFLRFGPDFMSIFILALGPRWMKFAVDEKITNYRRESQNLELELNFLQSQINPHFLFNTLNNIYLLLDFDAEKGKEMVFRLSTLMRYNVYESKNETIDLDKELDFIIDFLSLMRLRYGNKVKVISEISRPAERYSVIPLLMISFIENAFKHGPDKNPTNNFVSVKVKVVDGYLYMNVENKFCDLGKAGESKSRTKYGGIGVMNVKRRLELYHSGRYDLDIDKKGNLFCVNMKIPLITTGN